MKSVFRIVRLLSLLGIIISIILLLNITAPNPTGRRYSSEMPLTTGQGSGYEIGKSGENILSKDLGIPNNNSNDSKQCICGNDSTGCNVCLVRLPSLSNFRVPDFVGLGFLAESKNEAGLLYSGREVSQINDYVLAALLLKMKLWVYVRVDTVVSPEFIRLVESTGGAVIPYFTVAGYVDPVDVMARGILFFCVAVLAVTIIIGWIANRLKSRPVFVTLPSPPKTPKRPTDPVSRAVHKTGAAEDFVGRAKDKEKRRLDIEDARDEL